MDQGGTGLSVGHFQHGLLAVLHLNAVGGGVQAVALGGLQFYDFIPALFRLGKLDHAVVVGGEGADDLPVQLPNFHLYVRNALGGLLILLDDGQALDHGVIDCDGLRVGGVHLHRLRPCALVHDIAGERFGFSDHQRAGHAGNADLPVAVRLIQPLAGQVAVVVVQIAAVRVGDLELHPGQRSQVVFIQFSDHDAALCPVIKAERLNLALLDLVQNFDLLFQSPHGGD